MYVSRINYLNKNVGNKQYYYDIKKKEINN